MGHAINCTSSCISTMAVQCGQLLERHLLCRAAGPARIVAFCCPALTAPAFNACLAPIAPPQQGASAAESAAIGAAVPRRQ